MKTIVSLYAAISSPLLDDINLQGAKGILVNITAGLDMGIHEFEEVGAVMCPKFDYKMVTQLKKKRLQNRALANLNLQP